MSDSVEEPSEGALLRAARAIPSYATGYDMRHVALEIDAAVQAERERIAVAWVKSPPDRHALTSVEIDKAARVAGLSDEVAAEWGRLTAAGPPEGFDIPAPTPRETPGDDDA